MIENQIFVFGSNRAGRHGAGAAKAALEHYDAKWGVGEGLTGKSYALPTKDHKIETLPINEVVGHVNTFIAFAKNNPQLIFMVTKIGCGLAGFTEKEIAPMFKEAVDIPNIKLPKDFLDILCDTYPEEKVSFTF